MAIEVSVRRARAGDEHALALVGQATFLETFSGVLDGAAIVQHCRRAHSSDQYAQWLGDEGCALWIAEVFPGDAPVGYAMVTAPDLPGADVSQDLELKRIYLLGRYQGSGIGKRLLEQAVAHAKAACAARLLLGVYAGNEPAIGFYQRQGFVDIAKRQFNVGGRDYDDHVMGLALNSDPAQAIG